MTRNVGREMGNIQDGFKHGHCDLWSERWLWWLLLVVSKISLADGSTQTKYFIINESASRQKKQCIFSSGNDNSDNFLHRIQEHVKKDDAYTVFQVLHMQQFLKCFAVHIIQMTNNLHNRCSDTQRFAVTGRVWGWRWQQMCLLECHHVCWSRE